MDQGLPVKSTIENPPVKSTTKSQDYFNSIHDNSPNTNQSNCQSDAIIHSPVFSEDVISIHSKSKNYTRLAEPKFLNCLAPRSTSPKKITSVQGALLSIAPESVQPIIRTRQPSAYSATSSTFILQDPMDFKTVDYLRHGTVLCAVVSKAQIRIENGQLHHKNLYKDKKKLIWKKYNAVITQKGQLHLYKSCLCKDMPFHLCFSFGDKRPKHKVDLCPADKNILFDVNKTSNHVHSDECTTCYKLSLQSPIDYSWSLSSPEKVFFFQSNSVRDSQDWYQALYLCLPPRSKKPLPKTFNLTIPDISSIINLPLANLEPEEGQNVDLSKVRDSALDLLHRNGLRPSGWNQSTIGICWKSEQNEMDWVLKPMNANSNDIAYLIEPRLVEKTHELQMRLYNPELETIEKKPDTNFAGYILDVTKTRKLLSSNPLIYVSVIDHYMFLYAVDVPAKKVCWLFKQKSQLIPTAPPLESTIVPRNAIGVINILDYKRFEEDMIEQKENQHILHIDNMLLFQVMNQPSRNWSKKLELIKETYKRGQSAVGNELVRSATMYVKHGVGRMNTFKQRTCILTKSGDLCLFKTSSKSKAYRKFKACIKVKDNPDFYIYSGAECCSYINGIPLFQNARLFKSENIEANNNRPKESCFVIKTKSKSHVFFANSKQEKDEWVQFICSLLEK